MPQNATIPLPAGTWVLLTNVNVTAVTFQVLAPYGAFIAGAIGAVPPQHY